MTKFSLMRVRVYIVALCLVASALSFGALAKDSKNHSDLREGRRREAIGRALQKANHQILIRLHEGVAMESIRPRLPEYITISQKQGFLAILQSERKASPEDVRMILRIPGIAHAQIDSIVVTHEDPENCQPSFVSQVMEKLGLPASLTGCTTSTLCPNSGKSKLWAQERVDADLMEEELKRMGLGSGEVNVAVIDSGFDLHANRAFMESSSLKVKMGHDKAGEPTVDEIGHGTMVAGLIGGKSGIGIAPEANLTVYRVSEPDSEGSTSHASLQLSIEKACSEGNEIINVSWGGGLDESGFRVDEKEDQGFIQSLAKRGCLVVKSAGNSAFRKRDRSADNPDDAYLRVAAISDSGSLSEFSTPGEISAPGSGVFTLVSTQIPSDQKPDQHKKCGEDSGAFVNGTSFSAPIVSAVAARVLGVLKKSPKYRNLSGPNRIKLLNRIIIASQVAGSVNALRAILIADQWAKNHSLQIPETNELSQSLIGAQEALCQQKANKCAASIDCQELNACVRMARKKLALCSNTKVEAITDLIDTQISTGNLESAAGALNYFKTANQSPGIERSLGSSAEKLWNACLERWSYSKFDPKLKADFIIPQNLDFDISTRVLSTYFKADEGGMESRNWVYRTFDHFSGLNKKEKIKKSLDQLIKSDSFQERLNESMSRGGEESFADFYPVLKAAGQKLGSSELKRLLESQMKDEVAYDRKIVAQARLLDALIRDEDFKNARSDFLEMEKHLFKKLNRPEGIFNDDTLLYLEPMLQRNKDSLVGLVTKAQESKDYSILGSAQLLHLTKNPHLIPKNAAAAFFSDVVGEVAEGGASWGSNDLAIFQDSASYLRKEITSKSDKKNTALAKEFQSKIAASPNYQVIRSVFPFSILKSVHEFTLSEEVDRDPLLSRKFLFDLARQTALAIPKQEGKTNEIFQLERNSLISAMLPYLLGDPHSKEKSPRSFQVTRIPDSLTKTDVGRARKAGPLQVEDKPVPEALDSLLSFLVNDFREASQSAPEPNKNTYRQMLGAMPIREILSNEAALAVLPPEGKWKQSMRQLIADAEIHKQRYPESLVISLKKHLR